MKDTAIVIVLTFALLSAAVATCTGLCGVSVFTAGDSRRPIADTRAYAAGLEPERPARNIDAAARIGANLGFAGR